MDSPIASGTIRPKNLTRIDSSVISYFNLTTQNRVTN